jgi:hypothetical protein
LEDQTLDGDEMRKDIQNRIAKEWTLYKHLVVERGKWRRLCHKTTHLVKVAMETKGNEISYDIYSKHLKCFLQVSF